MRRPRWLDRVPGDGDSEVLELDLRGWNPDQDAVRAMLDDTERARVDRFVFPGDRQRFVAGRYLIRRRAAELQDREPQAVTLTIDAQGRPVLPEGPHFSLAHAEDRVLCAVRKAGRIGIDVEPIRAEPAGVTGVVFTDREVAHVLSAAENTRARAFFTLWTRKEAVLKAMGTGFLRDPRTVCVLADEASPERPVAVRSYSEDGYVFALAVATA